ncbi:MAG TPA: hypothetical protein PKM65_18085 [Spirochaetota bacterium]|nr:hypothetical protein [Spirochaetota bacterium]HNT13103.1 hypothetical protein [Spirochaetota bacterium]
MGTLQISKIREAAAEVDIQDERMAADIVRHIVELKDNARILNHLRIEYGIDGKGVTLKRKFNGLVQQYIIRNHLEEFEEFCKKNGIGIFNNDLETAKTHSSYARIVFIVFLREEVGLRTPVRIVE